MTRLKQARWLLKRVTIGLAVAAGLMGADFDWHLPKGFPRPIVPADNPMSPAKVELGRYLFYDKRISVNGKESCASCHRQELAFTDGRSRRGHHRTASSSQQHESGQCGIRAVADLGKPDTRFLGRTDAHSDVR